MTRQRRPLRTSIASLFAATILILAATGTTPPAALAASCAFNYTAFETIIPHVDLETCPDAATGTDTFCRATTAADQVHVFYFDLNGDQCLLKIESYDEDKFEIGIKK
ncbi:MAG: hypothetical protein AAFV45_06960 [Pseudomonadota bacterium]